MAFAGEAVETGGRRCPEGSSQQAVRGEGPPHASPEDERTESSPPQKGAAAGIRLFRRPGQPVPNGYR